jgi:hypothetical protein
MNGTRVFINNIRNYIWRMRNSRELIHVSDLSSSSLSGVLSRCSAVVHKNIRGFGYCDMAGEGPEDAALGTGFTHTAVRGRANDNESSSSRGLEA